MIAPSPPGRPEPPGRDRAKAPSCAPQMAIVWPLRPAHGTAVAPRDAYECASHGHPRAVPSPGGAGSRRPRPRIRPPPKKNSKTLIAPRTPELTD